jgi:uncharacterized protein (TIGR02246 family)
MTTAVLKSDDEASVRQLIDEWAAAARASDYDAIMSFYAPDIVAFDAVGRLQFKGRDAYRQHWEECLASCSGPMIFEVHDLQVVTGGGVAFGHYLSRCGGTGQDGVAKVSWMRRTVCCRHTDDRWLIVHEHFSAPFDMSSGKALFDLQP